MRYVVEIAFDGSSYHGWQIQPNAHTVQQEIEEKLKTLLQEKIGIMGCGRTDTGVHARQFFFHFDSEQDLNVDFVFRMNQLLAADISMRHIWQTPDDFHSRFQAQSRTYTYHIHRLKDPFQIKRSYYFRSALNLIEMNNAANWLLSNTEFGAFCKSKADNKTNICRLSECNWLEQNDQLLFTITADRFLRNMVRAVVGTLLDIGLGKTSLSDLQAIVATNQRSAAGESVPAHGLYLAKVVYDQTSWKLIG